MSVTIVAEGPDGQQVMCKLWDTPDAPHVALRPHSGAIWGPPLRVLRVEIDPSAELARLPEVLALVRAGLDGPDAA